MASSIENVTVVDSGAYDCGVCESPLKPPIFQCEVGHMVCSECREKMAAAELCHVCRRAVAGGYKRCYGAEHIVECLRVECPNKANGCSVMLPRYDQSAHLQTCQYRPFHCPAEDCTFAAFGVSTLRHHFVHTHGWPFTQVLDGTANLVLVDGFNVIKPYPWFPPGPPPQTGNRRVTSGLLVLLKVTPQSYGRVVTPIHIRHPKAKKFQLNLAYETPCSTHRLQYAFNLASTDLTTSGGLPSFSFDDCFEFVVPKSLQPLDMDTIKVAFTCRYLDDLES